MGSLVGHVLPGLAFFLFGLWHLFSQIRLHSLASNTHPCSPWFPAPKLRYMELYFIMIGTSISISMELFIGPSKHQPFDTDGTIPSNHLRNFEHSLISTTLFVYATFAIILDKVRSSSSKLAHQEGLTLVIGAIAFVQEFLLFHLHSTDHVGLEGHYHWLLQLVIFVSLSTTLLGIGLPKCFLVGFVRSCSLLFQGVWFVVTGYMLYTPQFIPKGCFMRDDDGHKVVICHTEDALHRAKSLVNIEFSWYLVLVTIFCMSFYLFLIRVYGKKDVEYSSLTKEEDEEEEEDNTHDIESQKPSKLI